MNSSLARRLLRTIAPIALALALVVVTESVVWACPGCKDALASNDPDRARASRGYFWSIIFMLSMPPAILVTLSSYFYVEVRRARADKARLESQKAEAKSES